MGQEAKCIAKISGKKVEGKALLETSEIIFRSEALRLKISFAEMKSVKAAGGELRLQAASGPVVFELGAKAEKWAQKILHPKSRMEKLGVKAGARVAVIGKLEAEFEAELKKAAPGFTRGKISGESESIFLAVDSQKELAQTAKVANAMKGAAALWMVYPKGRKDITENDVIAAGRKAGLKDVKVVGFSATHTALKFVIPVEKR